MCELLHTVSANQTCSSVESLFWGGPARAGCTETADNWCSRPFIELGGYSLTHRLEAHFQGKPGCAAPGSGPRVHLDSERFRSPQTNSCLPHGPAHPLGGRLSLRQTHRAGPAAEGGARGKSDMKRREFITLLGGAVAWPLPASAQQTPKLPTIGPVTASVENQRVAAFVQRLRAAGWIEGHSVAIKVRWADGRSERAAEIVAEFVQQKVDVLVSRGTVSVLAAKQAKPVIPIVFAGGDPVGTGFVVMGGNVTGLSLEQTDLAGKRLELLREVVPALRQLAILASAGNPVTLLDMRDVEAAAGTLGLTVVTVEIRRMEDIAPGFRGG